MTQVATPPQTLKPSAEGEGWKARPIRLKVFGRERTADEAILGVHIGSYSVRAKDPEIVANAQDGGAVSALMLYALEKKIIDYALVSGFTSREPWKPAPKVARTR